MGGDYLQYADSEFVDILVTRCVEMDGHRIVGVVTPDGILVLGDSVFKTSFGSANIERATFTFESIHHIGRRTVGIVAALKNFTTEYIREGVGFVYVGAMVA